MTQRITNTSEKDLLVAIKDLLKTSGHLNKFQAEIRAKVTEALCAKQASINTPRENHGPPQPPEEVALVNELIREYLEWNGYLYTSTVMKSEAGLPDERKSRASLCTDVGVKDDDKSFTVPLLSNIVAAYTERIKRKINKCKKET